MEADFYLWEHLKETKKSIVIYGMGDGCDKILGICKEKGIPVQGIFASDEYVRDKNVHGFPLKTYRQIREELGDVIVLLAFAFRDTFLNLLFFLLFLVGFFSKAFLLYRKQRIFVKQFCRHFSLSLRVFIQFSGFYT